MSLARAAVMGVRWCLRTVVMKTDPVRYARSLGVRVGNNVKLIGIHGGTFGSEPYLISIGNDITIAGGVQFVTHDGSVCVLRKEHPGVDVFGRISVADNCFIGYGAIILPGVSIGRNSIVAAGAVVATDVPDGVLVGGVPAKVIKSYESYRAAMLPKTVRVQHLSQSERRRVLEGMPHRQSQVSL